ncbi:MAG: type II secretion system protein [Patescibacteria group bacterium]
MKTKNQKGFTLLELLVVLAIITLIFSLILASTSTARKKARDSRRVSDFSEFVKALEMFYNKYGVYPCGDNYNAAENIFDDSSRSCPFLDGESYSGMNPPTSCSTFHSDTPCGNPEYGLYRAGFLSVFQPRDPISNSSYDYEYTVAPDRQKYLLQARLEATPNRMQNDGGLCNNRYEFGPGLGDLVLTRITFNFFNIPCN